MTYLSIIEKLKILFNTMLDFEFIFVFIGLVLILTFIYMIKKMNTKVYIVMLMLLFIGVFGISMVGNYEVLSNTFDNFATIFFSNIYFPSIYVYIATLFIGFIAFVVSILNVMLKKIYKIINGVMFVVNNILFVIILNIIAKNKTDIFSINSLYANTSLVAILELSMGLFILWLLSLITVYVTNSICDRLANKRVVKGEVQEKVFNPVLEVTDYLVNDVNTLNASDEIVSEPFYVEAITNSENDLVIEQIQDAVLDNVITQENCIIEDNIIIEESNTEENIVNEDNLVMTSFEEKDNVTFNDILNGTIPVTYYDNSVSVEDSNLVDPQVIYEDNYNKVKRENVIFNDVNVLLNCDVEEEVQLSVEELTQIEKEGIIEERLTINTISLNDLIDEEDVINEVEIKKNNNIDVLEVENKLEDNTGYTVDDYKKFITMLTELKNYSNGTNINIDDAVAISLISNYSIDDCMKFKNILENNVN